MAQRTYVGGGNGAWVNVGLVTDGKVVGELIGVGEGTATDVDAHAPRTSAASATAVLRMPQFSHSAGLRLHRREATNAEAPHSNPSA